MIAHVLGSALRPGVRMDAENPDASPKNQLEMEDTR